jgi:hypothetical protein
MKRYASALALAALMVAVGAAEGGECCHCGCHAPCHKVCRLVCEEKKVEITCWGCKCEDFCVPCPSRPGCTHCEIVCDDCAQPEGEGHPVISKPMPFVWREWFPCKAERYTTKKLMRRTVTKKVPSYKWVVEEVCGGCASAMAPVEVDLTVRVPPPPALGADTLLIPVTRRQRSMAP